MPKVKELIDKMLQERAPQMRNKFSNTLYPGIASGLQDALSGLSHLGSALHMEHFDKENKKVLKIMANVEALVDRIL